MAQPFPPRSPGPHLAVSIGVWKGRAVLLVRRGRGPYAGIWSFPGGVVELGERLETAALRELREETGVAAEIERKLDTVEIIRTEPDGTVSHHYLLTVFRGRHLTGEPIASDDAMDARWFLPDELAGIDMTPDTARLVVPEPTAA